MKNTNHSKTIPQFKDVSRFTRWMASLDMQDEGLSPAKRKTKWLLVLGTLLLAFVLSFVLFPSASMNHEKMGGPVLRHESTSTDQQAAHPFEMPADSFENLLKNKIHESNHLVPKEK